MTSQRGQSLVEFAFVAPFFFVIFFGIFEAAMFINAQVTMDNATREGLRAATICGSATIYSYQGSTSTAGTGSTATGCRALAENVVYANLGYLKAIYPQNPQVNTYCPPVPPNSCAAGSIMQVKSAYTYTYFIPSFLGLADSAHTVITSSAQGVAQQ